jgi:hypothetical protein
MDSTTRPGNIKKLTDQVAELREQLVDITSGIDEELFWLESVGLPDGELSDDELIQTAEDLRKIERHVRDTGKLMTWLNVSTLRPDWMK